MLSHGSNMNLAFYSIAIMNAAGIVGRIGNGYIADRVSVTSLCELFVHSSMSDKSVDLHVWTLYSTH